MSRNFEQVTGDERRGVREIETAPLRRRDLLGVAVSSAAIGSQLLIPQRSNAFIQLPQRLHNRYIMVRHGESVLEQRGLVQTNPAFKYDITYSLTDKGTQQMAEICKAIGDNEDLSPSWIYTSNFQRSYQSALILRHGLGILFANFRFEFSGLLDPRKMGALDGQDASLVSSVWEADQRDLRSTPPPVPSSLQPSASVESVNDVYRRALEAFTRLEGSYYGADIILVSHEDTLSIFTAALLGTDLGRHHIDYPYELGQYRVLDLTGAPTEGAQYDPRDIRGNLAPQDDRSKYNFTSNGLLLPTDGV